MMAGLMEGKQSPVKIAEQVEKSVDGDMRLWLGLQQKILWQFICAALGVATMPEELRIFETQWRKPGFQKRAYRMLEEIQQALYEVQGPSNPNLQLVAESLLIRWQALFHG